MGRLAAGAMPNLSHIRPGRSPHGSRWLHWGKTWMCPLAFRTGSLRRGNSPGPGKSPRSSERAAPLSEPACLTEIARCGIR